MSINREDFASQVYLRLMDSRPASDPAWLREEAIRQADDFIETMKQHRDKQPKKSRGAVNV